MLSLKALRVLLARFKERSLAIALIDIADFHDSGGNGSAVVSQWRDALDTIGFVTISGHGISSGLMADLHRQACAFFEQPRETKTRFMVTDPAHRGAA